jgi:methyl-accepting chemotaxis protein
LHNQLQQLEGISSHLPLLTARLSELSQLHTNAAEFGSRLDAAEETLGRTEALLSNLEEAVGRMEKGWKENMERMERNVNRLDEIVAGK